MTCPGDLELARAHTVGAEPALAAHLAACAACRASWDATRSAIDLARELPVALPPPARREEMRTAVLAAGSRTAQRRVHRRWLAPAILGAAAAGGVGLLAIARDPEPSTVASHHHGIVRAHPGARYLASSVGADEVVRLIDGAIDVEVEPLSPGERFRVIVGDAELEVRGTAFTVTASAERLIDVAVAHGRVDLRPPIGAPASLGTGQSWRATPREPAPIASDPAPIASEPAAAASPRPLRSLRSAPPAVAAAPTAVAPAPPAIAPAPPAIAPEPPARAPDELAYDQAWEALRAGDFARAASGFSRVLTLAPDGALAEDAGFWRAVALARGKRSGEALSEFRDFLDGHARSPRAGEASAMLGWLLVGVRDYDEASRRFTAALGDTNPAVRRSAQAGLDALAKRSH